MEKVGRMDKSVQTARHKNHRSQHIEINRKWQIALAGHRQRRTSHFVLQNALPSEGVSY